MKKILLCIFLLGVLNSGKAQDGQLDSSFGKGGIVITDIGDKDAGINNDTNGERILLDADGSMYFISGKLGVDLLFISKKNKEGKPDLSYGKNGYSTSLNLAGNSPAILQQDGKIVIAGNIYQSSDKYYTVVYRLNTNGSLDSTFNEKGFKKSSFNTNCNATDVSIQKDGKIVVAGFALVNNTPRYLLYRLNTNGSEDISFTQIGKLTDSIEIYRSIAVQENGKIVAGGYKKDLFGHDIFTLSRHNTDGSIDTGFKQTNNVPSGELVIHRFIKILIDGDGNILVAGTIKNNFGIARFKQLGGYDTLVVTNFKSSPYFNYLSSAALGNDGKIMLMGTVQNNSAVIASYNKDLSINTNFSEGGELFAASDGFISGANSVTIQKDGKILLSGYINRGDYPNIAAERLNSNGSIDASFADKGKLYEIILQGNAAFEEIAVQNDGKIVAGGYAFNGLSLNFAMARYTTSGSLDTSFSDDGKVTTNPGNQFTTNILRSLAIQTDGEILAGGEVGTGNSLVRYNANGSVEHDFGLVGNINSIAIQKDGRFIICSREGLARYRNFGVDNTFNGVGFLIFPAVNNFSVSGKQIALQKDEKIIVLGWSTEYPSYPVIFRYHVNGKLDSSFGTNGIFLNYLKSNGETANAVSVQTDDKILIGGSYQDFSNPSIHTFSISRLNKNGSRDSTFNEGKILHAFTEGADAGNSIKLQSDGKIIIAGNSMIDGQTVFKIARFYSDGSIDKTFNHIGSVTTYPGGAYANLANIAIKGNNLYVAGCALFPGNTGIIAKYRLCNAPEVLQLKIIQFAGKVQNNIISLNWAIENQQKLSYFTVEKSIDSIHFISIENITASHINNPKAKYSSFDNRPSIGANYYRLKLKNTDSTHLYSQLVNVNLSYSNLSLKISPNPSKTRLVVTTNGENERATIQIFDAFGRKFKEIKVVVNGNTSIPIDIDTLPAGIYTVQIIKKLRTETSTFIKQ